MRRRYTEDTYQPFADAALASRDGVAITFRDTTAKAKARLWQQQFCRWRGQQGPGTYFGLTTRRARVSTDPDVWEVKIMTHQSARSGFVVHDLATGEVIDLDKYDEVLKARNMDLDDLMDAVHTSPPATDQELEALPDDLFGESPE